MEWYIEKHLETGGYRSLGESGRRYENSEGWIDCRVGRHIVFAHRENDYTAENFRDALHAHEYAEVILWCGGDVQYVSGDRTEDPAEGTVIVIPPRETHTTRLLSPTRYERYVVYISSSAFSEIGFGNPLSLFQDPDGEIFSGKLCGEELTRARAHLRSAEIRLDAGGEIGAYADLIEFLLLATRACSDSDVIRGEGKNALPAPVREIRRYIEASYATIPSVEALAAHFYYSREYLSRLFRRYYNLSPGDYIEQCRIRAAEERIASGERIADVCYGVGYRSMSAFSAAFRRVTGKPPSALRGRETKYSQICTLQTKKNEI